MRPLLSALLLPLLSAPAAEVFDPAALANLETLVEKAVAKNTPPGVVLWLERNQQVHTLATGARALRPQREAMTLDSLFDAASLTKVVATLPCILALMEEGRLHLEDPVVRHLPDFNGGDNIQLRHLLTHLSGLPAGLPREPAWSGYDAGLRLALTCQPEAPPDTRFRYSDVNFILLGEIVQRVSGRSLNAYARQRIFAPLSMHSTGFNPPAEWQSRTAPTEPDENGVLLRGVVHDPTARRMGGVAGHAGLFTTAADLARYARMILGGGELDGIRVLQTRSIKAASQVQTPATVFERRSLGWDLDSPFSHPRGKLFPLGSFGHTGFSGTSLWIDPHSHSFVVFLSSRLHPRGGGSVRDLYEAVGTAAAKALQGIDWPAAPIRLRPRQPDEVPTVLNGIDVLRRDDFAALTGKRIGLITNATGITARRESTIDVLTAAPGVQLRALFSPEHGIRGELDQETIRDSRDAKTGLPVFSLYGERRAPSDEQLRDLDALVFDIQDIGCRFYTYISTLRLCLEAAARCGLPFYVLDRVNPVGGSAVEGPVVLDKETFTATHAIAIRHGMTAGELARLMNSERGLGAELHVIPVEGWRRGLLFDETGLPWQNPSPNMRNPTAALLYPGIGLLEFSISVGRGTDSPFELLGAPYIDDLRLAHELNRLGLPGLRFLPVRFTPSASLFKDQPCAGVRLVVTGRRDLDPVRTGLAIAATLQRLYPGRFDLDKVGTLLNHRSLLEDLRHHRPLRWQQETEAFRARRRPFLIYGE
jgi:uncharacterized protein YbbC (DUF1343 family)/CubicO group peptidase (beta-lactamase class C family)